MHELKIIQDILPLIEKTAQENSLTSITKIILKIGKLRQVKNEFLQFAFTTVSENTIASQAKLIIEQTPIIMYCQICKEKFMIDDNIYICHKCNGSSIKILTGKEIVLESIDGEY